MLKKLDKIWFIIIYFELKEHYFKKLATCINIEYYRKNIYPAKYNIINFCRFTEFNKMHTIIIGQDPYCKKGQAHGLAFSTMENKLPASLYNIYTELYNDIGVNNFKKNGDLTKWATQGICMLNTILTVEENKPGSHKDIGWENLINKIIKKISDNKKKVIFVLLGKNAHEKIEIINIKKHITIMTTHPSPLSANKGFLGSRIFSKINTNLKLINNNIKIEWCI